MGEALFSTKKAKERGRAEAARQSLLGAQAVEAVSSAKAQATAAEEARANIFGMLGAPGTYDLPGTGSAGPGAFTGDYYDTTSDRAKFDPLAKGLLQYTNRLSPEARAALDAPRQGILDPTKFAEETGKTASFRIQSRQTAEAEQLLAQEGPAWNMLQNSTIGAIVEGAGMMQRETMRDLKSAAAKGGSARRAALNEANQMLARERATTARVNQTWEANLSLFKTVRENADRVQQSNQRFLDGLPQLRTDYMNTMSGLAELMAGTAIPTASKASSAGFQARQSVPESRVVEKLIGAAVSMVGAYAGASIDPNLFVPNTPVQSQSGVFQQGTLLDTGVGLLKDAGSAGLSYLTGGSNINPNAAGSLTSAGGIDPGAATRARG